MRTSIWGATLVVGLALAGSASAGAITGYGGSAPVGISTTPSASPGLGLATYLRNTFNLTRLFRPFPMMNKVQVSRGSIIPNPESPEYLKAFGYRRLTPR
jgi:hypothetical protein